MLWPPVQIWLPAGDAQRSKTFIQPRAPLDNMRQPRRRCQDALLSNILGDPSLLPAARRRMQELPVAGASASSSDASSTYYDGCA
jgi:hypothetical protein